MTTATAIAAPIPTTAAVKPKPKTRLRTGMRMSLDEFLARGETDGCQELDDGVLRLMPSANPEHQFLQTELIWHLMSYLRQFREPPALLFPDLTVVLSQEQQRAPEPDLVIILTERAGIVGRSRVEGAPDIVVEILSSDRARDLAYKRRIYAEAGVKEYWIVDPRYDTVLPLALRDGAYPDRPALGVGDMLTTPLLPGLAIPLADLFRHRRRPARDAE